jgi:hypothetical protein
VQSDVTESVDARTESSSGDVTESVSDDTADIVESLTDATAPTGTVTTTAPSSNPEPEAGRASVTGWASEHVEWTFWNGGLRNTAPDPLVTRRNRLLSRTQLLVRSSYHRGRWLEAVASGVLGVESQEEGPASYNDFNGLNGQTSWQFATADLLELYVGLSAGNLDLRFGQQRVPWGKADVLSPNDIVNSRDLTDPFYGDQELRYRPTPIARADFYADPFVFELLGSPVFIADRSSLSVGNWSALQPDAPAEYRGLYNLIGRVVDPSLRRDVDRLLQQTRYPNQNGAGASVGAKIGFSVDGLDVNGYYHYGHDGTPFLSFDPAFVFLLKGTDFAHAQLADLAPLAQAIDRGLRPLSGEFVRRHHFGLDASRAIGPFVFRLDAAFETQRVYYRMDLTSASYPTVLAVASIEYQTGDVDRIIVVETVYIGLLEPPAAPLLAYNQHSFGFATVFRWPVIGALSLELRGTLGLMLQSYTVQPALRLKLGDFVIKLGGILLNGEPRSLGWYYRHNASAMLQVRYTF